MSLKEIAKMTGTSVSTVSRILNNPGYQSRNKELTNKVFDAAASIGYIPNTSAQRLKGSFVDKAELTVDLLITRFTSVDEDDFFLEISQLIKKELLSSGCRIGNTFDLPSMLELKNKPARQQNTGLIVLGKLPMQFKNIITRHYAHFIGVDRNPTQWEYDEVVCDGQAAARSAMEYLLSLGHTRIAYIGDCTSESRYLGYYNTLIDNRLPLNYNDIYQTNQTESQGFDTYMKILNAPSRPTAIFCANDSTAIGVLNAMNKTRKSGYMPSVISIDNSEASSKTSPMLTTIEVPKEEMSHLSVLLLLDRIKKNTPTHIRVEVPSRLIVRESCSFI